MQKFLDECDYLIHLVRCTVHNLQPRELPDGLDFERVYEWGVYHHIANVAFYSVEKLENKPREELYSKWQACRDQAIVRDITQNYAAMELRQALRDAGVRTLEVQGTKIKPLYPQPEWRTMSDIDFIIDQENLPKATEILQSLGYKCQNICHTAVDAHRSPNINIEMHTDFFAETSEYRQVMRDPFASVDENGQCELNAFYLYNILHIAKHYFSGGCGIRRVLDVYYLNENYGQIIHRTDIQNALKCVNAADFAADLGRLANAWFGREEQAFPRTETVRYIQNSGLHGSRPNELNHYLEKTFDNTGRFAKLKYFLRRFLGTGGDLQKKYPILERRKILYPFCWIHRSIRALQPGRIKRIRKEFKAVMNAEATEE